MNNKVTDFLDSVCVYIRFKAAHKDIRDELAQHIDDLQNKYLEQGHTVEQALDLAIAAMGDCAEIGKRLNKQHQPQIEWSLIGLVSFIAIIGVIIMFTSSQAEKVWEVNFARFLLFAFIGIVVCTALCVFDYRKLRQAAWPIYLIAMGLLALYMLFGYRYMFGFLRIGPYVVSVNYIILLLSLAFAGFIDRYRDMGLSAVIKLAALAIISVMPVLLLPGLSFGGILLICYMTLFLTAVLKNHFGGNKKAHRMLLGGVGLFIAISYLVASVGTSYQFSRLNAFLSRGAADPSGIGYQHVMADAWLAASNWFGEASTTINGFGVAEALPAATTDFVLVNVIATLGWVVGITLVLSIALFILRMIIITKKIKNTYGFYLALAACSLLAAQFIINILMNFNFFPLAGIGLPFVSYGGSGYIVNMALVGIILSVWRRNNLISETPRKPSGNSDRLLKIEDGKIILRFR